MRNKQELRLGAAWLGSVESGRVRRALLPWVAAVLLFLLARLVAHRFALTLFQEKWAPLAEQLLLAAFLLLGYAGLGLVLAGEERPFASQGWPLRTGWLRELGCGLASGWALALLCTLPLILIGGLAITFHLHVAAWRWLLADALLLLCAALAEELAFRGYGFERLMDGAGPYAAAIIYALFTVLAQPASSSATLAAICTSLFFSLLLFTARVRTQALWLSFGVNFAWKASRALLFGLPLAVLPERVLVVKGAPMGPIWLTGGVYGLESGWATPLLLLAAWPLLVRLTRELRPPAPEAESASLELPPGE